MSDSGNAIPAAAPATTSESLRASAEAFERCGDYGAAEQVYRTLLSLDAADASAMHRLGLLCVRMQRCGEGLPLLLAALEAQPQEPAHWLAYIEALRVDAQFDAARQALQIARSCGLQGAATDQLEARLVDDGTAAIEQRGPSPAEEAELVALFKRQRYAQGAEQALAMTRRFPAHGFAWKALATHLRAQGLDEDALPAWQKAAQLLPDDADVQYRLGMALQRRNENATALPFLQRATELDPEFVEAQLALGRVLGVLERHAEAVVCLRRALELKPDYGEAFNKLGLSLLALDELADAETAFRRALALTPGSAEVVNNLGAALEKAGRGDEAVTCYRQSLAIDPDFAVTYTNLLYCLAHTPGIDARSLFAEHRSFGEHFEATLRTGWPVHDNSREVDRCLRVGWVSGDFRNHAVACLIEPLLPLLAQDPGLELYAYANHHTEDEATRRLQPHFAQWQRVDGMSDEDLARKIGDDRIDILIDLSGHTAHNRLLCFARKPAPVQVSWLGYPGTTGLQAMDYFLADRYWLPVGKFDAQFVEKIVRLPATSPFLAPDDAPGVSELPAAGKGHLTFGSFNRLNKLSRATIALWSQLLRAVPDARLLLAGLPVQGRYDALIDWFTEEGVALDRLSFHARCDVREYLRLHHQVDICLDTFPYNGGTTTFQALWMGVPTLTLAGPTAAGHSGAAILGHVGLVEDFVAQDAGDFVAKGMRWAADLAALSSLRAGLRERFIVSVPGQPALVAEGLRRALRSMWQRWCAGVAPASFEMSMDGAPDRRIASQESAGTQPLYVTQPVLPPLDEFIPYLEKIWESKWLTNGGQFHQQLEQALCAYLGVKHLALFANGTLALVTALQALRIRGEVITTPYSFVATSHALLWNGIEPVFVDIDPQTLNLDARKIEAAITARTTAILPVHCYGHPCDVHAIQKVADNFNLKVIYDAAHAFAVQDAGGSILRHGDLSVLSFHATKVFTTFEGGAIICPDARTKQHIDHLKNFGFVDDATVVAAGINGKMSEINAAFGLLQLKGINRALQQRQAVDQRYREGLREVRGIRCVDNAGEVVANHAYFPILVGDDYPLARDQLFNRLKENGVLARRYFFPLISDFPMYRGMPSASQANLPVARKVAAQVICLPIYPDLSNEQIDFVIGLIARA